MKTYLVTGGAGFIGANFIKYMLDKYGKKIHIIVLDKLTYAGNLNTLEDNMKDITFIKGDISNKDLVEYIFANNEIDYVVNFAAESHVDRSIENPRVFLETNILGTQNLLDISRRYWQVSNDRYREGVKYLQVSTDEVYGSLEDTGYFTENTQLNPRSPYSASKASADMIVQSYMETYKFPANITRCSNNYGPYHFPEKLIPLMINNILNGKELPIYGDGKNVRDWLYVEDHCKAIDMVINDGRVGEVYNVGGHNEKQNIEIVKIVIDTILDFMNDNKEYKKTLNTNLEDINYGLITYVTDRKGHDRRYAIDPTKIINELNWYPETKFEDGIVKTIKWYLENQEWVQSVISGDYQKYHEQMYSNR